MVKWDDLKYKDSEGYAGYGIFEVKGISNKHPKLANSKWEDMEEDLVVGKVPYKIHDEFDDPEDVDGESHDPMVGRITNRIGTGYTYTDPFDKRKRCKCGGNGDGQFIRIPYYHSEHNPADCPCERCNKKAAERWIDQFRMCSSKCTIALPLGEHSGLLPKLMSKFDIK